MPSYENIALRPIVLCGRLFAFFVMSAAPEEKEVFLKKGLTISAAACIIVERSYRTYIMVVRWDLMAA